MMKPHDEMRVDHAYRDLFEPREAARLTGIMGPVQQARGREAISRAGLPVTTSYYLSSGFMGRYCSDRLGRRQFVGLQIPGDFVDLPGYVLKTLDHDVDAVGPASFRLIAHAELDRIEAEEPALYQKLWRISMLDSAVHRYWIFRIGRLSGKARLANFFCEMFVRLFARGMAKPSGFALPTSQADLAEVCGVTPVHVNRLLAELRLDGVCVFSAGRLEVLDLARLFRVGEHTRDYLYLPASIEAQLAAMIGPAAARSPSEKRVEAPGRLPGHPHWVAS